MNKKKIIPIIYIALWVTPFIFLFRDFFELNSFTLIMDSRLSRILGVTFLQSILSTLISLAIAIIPSYYIYKKKNLISNILEGSIFIPFFFPPVSMVLAFSLLYSNAGLFSKLGIDLNILYTMKAIVLAHVFYNSPIFVKYIGEALRKIPNGVVEASKIDGASKVRTFFSIEVPMIMPSIMKAFFLVFSYSFMSFAVVLNLGGIKYSTLEVAIANTLRGSFDFSKALGYALIQFAILFVLNYVISKIDILSFEGDISHPKKVSKFVTGTSIIYLIFEFSIVFVGVFSAFFNFFDMKFDISGFLNLFSKEFNNKYPIVESIFNSLFVALIAATLSIVFTYIILKNYTKFTDRVILPFLGISSAFLAMGLLYINILYGIPFVILLIIGFMMITIPITYSFLFQHVVGFNKSLLEAASIDGANRWQSFWNIELPLILPSMISVFLQIFAIIYGEFTITYTMQVRDFFPLVSVVNYSLSANRQYLEANALSAFNIAIIIIIFVLSNRIKNRFYKTL
ncbi:thiamine transport system permease protein [Geotoga petraea]|uniref:Thiamine transport system permease protein n=2 Tax=Geotoga petraea TaxID=28234 RepID=A0A1G6L5A7_9BACT|nr:ABC transporter permease subunit [Geotoga petraea]SDC38318.1 thiamine transport system permease protein [Geotoga petraea]